VAPPESQRMKGRGESLLLPTSQTASEPAKAVRRSAWGSHERSTFQGILTNRLTNLDPL
jgi:hypothetical protein